MVLCNLKECIAESEGGKGIEMEATTEKTDEGDMVLYTCPKCGNEVQVPVHRKPPKKKWFSRRNY